jgi:hypothetical protein
MHTVGEWNEKTVEWDRDTYTYTYLQLQHVSFHLVHLGAGTLVKGHLPHHVLQPNRGIRI